MVHTIAWQTYQIEKKDTLTWENRRKRGHF